MKLWNKKIKHNLIIALGLWLFFAVLIISGILSFGQEIFDGFVFKSEQPLVKAPALWTIISLFFESVVLVFLINNIRPAYSLSAPFGLVLLYYLTGLVVVKSGIQLDFFFSFFTGMIVYLVNIIYNFLSFDRERKEIKSAFGLYLSPEYIDEIADNPEKLKLGGDNKELTIFFSDIRSFSTFSEKMSAPDLVTLLNEYLTAMTDIVMDNRGVVDKYIGDAVMAFWGAPIEDKEHAYHAIKTGLEMDKKLAELNQGWQQRGFPEIKAGIGINTSQVVVGNMGSKKRFNYTVMGDGVNLASRLEGLTKYYGVKIMISDSSLSRVGGKFCARQLDLVAVKGKKEPVKIFEVLGFKEAEPKFGKIVNLTERALVLYFAQQWSEAIKTFKELAELSGNKVYSDLFIERCNNFIKNSPGKDWDGVWKMTVK